MVDARILFIGFGLFMYYFESRENRFTEKIVWYIDKYIKTSVTQIFKSLPLFGPIMFFPVQYDAWTTSDVSSYQTLTYPIMIVINLAVYVSLCYNGEWRTRLSMIGWIVTMLSISLAGWVR